MIQRPAPRPRLPLTAGPRAAEAVAAVAAAHRARQTPPTAPEAQQCRFNPTRRQRAPLLCAGRACLHWANWRCYEWTICWVIWLLCLVSPAGAGLLHQAGKGHLARRAAAAPTYYLLTTHCSTFTVGVGPEKLSGGRERGGPAGACSGLTGGAADRRPA